MKSWSNKNNVDKKAQKEERSWENGDSDVCRCPECDEEYMNVRAARYGSNVSHATNGTTLNVQHSNLMIT